ncbi:MAG: LysR substrate-binding domain-containing protein [Ignavibacteria bacterium]|nr:LysR substrate-binding domain-containing protein [Ignavibacteria bacterium]
MNLQQLEYVIAVDSYRHFASAAQKCFVTQPTLSMMIQRLEEELSVIIFDRSRQPVVPTEIGAAIITQARKVVKEAAKMKELVREAKGEVEGELRLGIIPTLAPYLLPLFLKSFIARHPRVKLAVSELITGQVMVKLKNGELDAGLVVTPLNETGISEMPLFYERFFVYTSKDETVYRKKYVHTSDIDVHHLWLLEEGHCFRSQIVRLCELKKQHLMNEQFQFEAGSIETLKKLVDGGTGITIIPELAAVGYSTKDRKKIRQFREPVPSREVSLVTERQFVKQSLLEALRSEILASLPDELMKKRRKRVVAI